jgi:HD-like signal output (HDOD) protein
MAPAIFSRLSTLLTKPSTTLEDVVDTVQLDPILTGRIVRVANSPLYQRGEPVIAITDAIAYIGTQETSQIVGVMVAGQLFAQGLPHYNIDSDALWNCSVSSAVAARLLAARVGLPEGECYTIALLRGIGWLVLERFAEKNAVPIPEQPLDDSASVAKWDRQVFSMSSADAGLRVLNLWNFAPPAVAALRRLGKRPYTDPTTALLAIANAIGDRLGLGLEVERGCWVITPNYSKSSAWIPSASRRLSMRRRARWKSCARSWCIPRHPPRWYTRLSRRARREAEDRSAYPFCTGPRAVIDSAVARTER